MRWYDDLYVGYNLLDKKRQVMWKIKRGKQQFNKYVITLPFNDYDVLDIYPSNVLTQKWYKDSDIVIVGIAEGMGRGNGYGTINNNGLSKFHGRMQSERLYIESYE